MDIGKEKGKWGCRRRRELGKPQLALQEEVQHLGCLGVAEMCQAGWRGPAGWKQSSLRAMLLCLRMSQAQILSARGTGKELFSSPFCSMGNPSRASYLSQSLLPTPG